MHAGLDIRPALRVTERCLTDDLGLPIECVELPIETISDRHDLLSAFVDKRAASPIGQEVVTGLTSKVVAYTLHGGRYRGATWHQQSRGIVWLLASRLHRSGEPDDAYPYFRALDAKGALLPTGRDWESFQKAQARPFAESLGPDASALRQLARQSPGEIVRAVLVGRVRIRLCYEPGEPALLTVAICQRILPGEGRMPPDWLAKIAAAFLPETPLERLSLAMDIGGEELEADEIAFCDFG